jgi:hypothetical protein
MAGTMGGRAMPRYRVFLVDKQGHYTGGEVRDCPDDQTVLAFARLYVDGCDVEVWEHDRLVARLTPDASEQN